ncbi:MAG: preprotein translocase subunit SecE [Candidatus Dojkabacteria bacterium]|nr:MAG: preprotein translocase subunit SecE [Candidatus Dojkabacteria bacterium]
MARVKVKFNLEDSAVGRFLIELLRTYKTIQWPTPKELLVRTLVVLIFSAIISAYLLGADALFSYIRNTLLF